MRSSKDKCEDTGYPSTNAFTTKKKRVSFLCDTKTDFEEIDFSSLKFECGTVGNLFGTCASSRRSSIDDLRIRHLTSSPRSPSKKGHARDDSYARYPVTKITPSIFLGNDQDACDSAILNREKITHVLSLVGRNHPSTNAAIKIKRMCVPMNDAGNTEVTKLLNNGVLAFMEESQMKKNKLLVHCHIGQNRSPTILLAFLMKHHKLTLFRAWRMVKPKRVIVQPHMKYIQQLRNWDVYLNGKHSTPKDFLKLNVSCGNVEVEYESSGTEHMKRVLMQTRSAQLKSALLSGSEELQSDLDEDEVFSGSNLSLATSVTSHNESLVYEDQTERKCDLLPVFEIKSVNMIS